MQIFKTFDKTTNSGFTLIELIAVIAILGIITFLAVGSYTNRSEQAKETVAMHEMQQIANAEITVEANYGYYVPLTVLESLSNPPVSLTNDDKIYDKFSFYVVDALTTGSNIIIGGNTLTIGNMLNGQINQWKGPFMTYQRQTAWNGSAQYGYLPLDPWGGSYIFLSINGEVIDAEGVVNGSQGVISGFSNYTIGHFAIVSLGRDLTPGSPDNLYYTF